MLVTEGALEAREQFFFVIALPPCFHEIAFAPFMNFRDEHENTL